MNQNIEFKAIPGQFNIDEAQGIVECFVAGIGNKDSVGDVLVSGAFSKSLTRRKPRVVWGHNWNDPIGKVLEIYEVAPGDRRLPMKMLNAGIGGLYARVQFNLNSEKGREAFANVAFFGQEQEWSIGYKTLDSIFDPNIQANILKEVELYEVSPVLHGANQLTGTISVKSDEMVDDSKGGMMMVGPMAGRPTGMMPHRHHRPTPNILEANKPGIGDERKNQLEIELALRAGAPVKVRLAEENTVIFDRMTPEGAPTTYRVSYHFTGREFMFGKPEKVSVQTVYVPSSEESGSRVVVPSQMPSMPMQVKPQGNAYMGDDQNEYQGIMPKSYDDGEKWVFDDELADLANILSDSLDVKVGRALSSKNMSKLKAILENLQDVIASAEKDVESKSDYIIPVPLDKAFETKQLLDPIFDYHRVESHVTEEGIVVTSGVTNEFVEALGVAEKALGQRLGGGLGKLGRAARGAANFDPKAWDGDGDGLVQEGTPYQRPAIPGVNDRSTGGRVDANAATRAFRQAGGRVRENAKARRDEKRRGGLASSSDKPEPIKDEGRLYTWPVYEELNGEFVEGEVIALSDLYGDESVPGFGVVGIYDQDGSGEPGYFYGGDDEEFETVEDALGFLENIEKQGAKGKFYDDPNFKKFKPAKKKKREGLASTSYPASWQLPNSEDDKNGIRVLDSQVLSDRMAGLSLDDAEEKFGIPKEKLRKMEAREMARIREEMNPQDFVAYRMMGMSAEDLAEITGKTPAEIRQIQDKEIAKMKNNPSDTDLLQYRERGMSLDDLSEITGIKREELRKREIRTWNAKPEIPERDKPLNSAQLRQMAEDDKKKRRGGGLASTSVEKKPEVIRGEIVSGPGSKTPAKKYIERRVESGWINPKHQDALDEILSDVTPESLASEDAGDVLSDVRRNLLRAINDGKFNDYRGAEMREDSLNDYLTQQIAGAIEDAVSASINENIKKVQDARRKKLLEESRDELVYDWAASLVDSIEKIRSIDAPSDAKIAKAKKRATESRKDLIEELTDGSPEYDADSFWYSVGEILQDDPTIDSEDFLRELQDASSKGIKEKPDNEFMQAIQDELDADDNRFRSLVEAMEEEKLQSDYIPEKVSSKRTLARGLASTGDRRMRDDDNFDEYDEAFGPSARGPRRGMADDPVGDAAAENLDRDRNAQAVRRGLASTSEMIDELIDDGYVLAEHGDALKNIFDGIEQDNFEFGNGGEILGEARLKFLRALESGSLGEDPDKIDDYRNLFTETLYDSMVKAANSMFSTGREDTKIENLIGKLVTEFEKSLDSSKRFYPKDRLLVSEKDVRLDKQRAKETLAELFDAIESDKLSISPRDFNSMVDSLFELDPTLDIKRTIKDIENAILSAYDSDDSDEGLRELIEQYSFDGDAHTDKGIIESYQIIAINSENYEPNVEASKIINDALNYSNEKISTSGGLASTRGEGSMLARDGQIRRDEQGNVDPTEAREARAAFDQNIFKKLRDLGFSDDEIEALTGVPDGGRIREGGKPAQYVPDGVGRRARTGLASESKKPGKLENDSFLRRVGRATSEDGTTVLDSQILKDFLSGMSAEEVNNKHKLGGKRFASAAANREINRIRSNIDSQANSDMDLLIYRASGLSVSDTADLFNISPREVRKRERRLSAKLKKNTDDEDLLYLRSALSLEETGKIVGLEPKDVRSQEQAALRSRRNERGGLASTSEGPDDDVSGYIEEQRILDGEALKIDEELADMDMGPRHEEIARRLGIPVSEVKERVQRADRRENKPRLNRRGGLASESREMDMTLEEYGKLNQVLSKYTDDSQASGIGADEDMQILQDIIDKIDNSSAANDAVSMTDSEIDDYIDTLTRMKDNGPVEDQGDKAEIEKLIDSLKKTKQSATRSYSSDALEQAGTRLSTPGGTASRTVKPVKNVRAFRTSSGTINPHEKLKIELSRDEIGALRDEVEMLSRTAENPSALRALGRKLEKANNGKFTITNEEYEELVKSIEQSKSKGGVISSDILGVLEQAAETSDGKFSSLNLRGGGLASTNGGKRPNNGAPPDITEAMQKELIFWGKSANARNLRLVQEAIKEYDANGGQLPASMWKRLQTMYKNMGPGSASGRGGRRGIFGRGKGEDSTPSKGVSQDLLDGTMSNNPIVTDNFVDTRSGSMGGSQGGGVFRDPSTGKEYYIKPPKTQTHAENESLMSRFYQRLGLPAGKVRVGTYNGKPKIVSEMVPGAKQVNHATEMKNAAWKKAVQDTFVANAWLANWDATANPGNIIKGGDGKPYIIDTGGAGLFRARGERKGPTFGPIVGEMESLRDRKFQPLGDEYFSDIPPAEIARQVKEIGAISDDEIRQMVDAVISDKGEAKTLADTLIARRDYLVQNWSTGKNSGAGRRARTGLASSSGEESMGRDRGGTGMSAGGLGDIGMRADSEGSFGVGRGGAEMTSGGGGVNQKKFEGLSFDEAKPANWDELTNEEKFDWLMYEGAPEKVADKDKRMSQAAHEGAVKKVLRDLEREEMRAMSPEERRAAKDRDRDNPSENELERQRIAREKREKDKTKEKKPKTYKPAANAEEAKKKRAIDFETFKEWIEDSQIALDGIDEGEDYDPIAQDIWKTVDALLGDEDMTKRSIDDAIGALEDYLEVASEDNKYEKKSVSRAKNLLNQLEEARDKYENDPWIVDDRPRAGLASSSRNPNRPGPNNREMPQSNAPRTGEMKKIIDLAQEVLDKMKSEQDSNKGRRARTGLASSSSKPKAMITDEATFFKDIETSLQKEIRAAQKAKNKKAENGLSKLQEIIRRNEASKTGSRRTNVGSIYLTDDEADLVLEGLMFALDNQIEIGGDKRIEWYSKLLEKVSQAAMSTFINKNF